jgi:hypothetical protein
VLGAIVGGLAASEAVHHQQKQKEKRYGRGQGHGGGGKKQLISTVVGAAVGGLGANALERRLEGGGGGAGGGKKREKDRERYGGRDERDRGYVYRESDVRRSGESRRY